MHMSVIGVSTTISGLLLPGSGIFEIADATNKGEVIFSFIFIIIIPLLVILAGAMFAVYALTDPFTEEVKKLTVKIKSGDLSARIVRKELYEDSVFGPTSLLINEIVGHSKSLIEEVASTSEIITTTSSNLAMGAEEVKASAEEVSNTSQAMSNGASNQTEMISDTNIKIDSFKEEMDEIVKKIQMNTQEVSQIALQTNILALNAGIEASRAGDYGRGFMVVAENVRRLSDQSKLASERIAIVADDINYLILERFNEILSSMLNVVSVSEETASSAEEVAAAAEEMTATMEEISIISQSLSDQANISNEVLKQFLS